MPDVQTLVIGAGPAGLATAYQLVKQGHSVAVIERDPHYVGGISRTATYKNYRFDIGGHRFFSKSAEIEALWTEILGDELIERPRSSRIYYNEKLFDYPLKAMDALKKLGPVEAVRCVLSYAKARAAPTKNPKNFEQWVVNHFGRRLFEIFFKTYTEKVWGMDCAEISADWAAQRIKGLSLWSAIISSFGFNAGGDDTIKTLIGSFRYPRLGPGQMWERARDLIVQQGSTVQQGVSVVALSQTGDGLWNVETRDRSGKTKLITARHVVSSAPMTQLTEMLRVAAPEAAKQAASKLRYRDFLIVGLIARGAESFDDNWIYIHDPNVRVGRIQNFKSWSPDMVPDPSTSSYGMEYFCFEGDGLWQTADEKLIEMAKAEINQLGLVPAETIVDGTVIRQPKAYPVYDDEYQFHVDTIREALDAKFTGLHLIGRNGMHKYNNQDHAMMTGLLTAENIISGTGQFDPWAVNQDAEYHEGGAAGSAPEDRMVPRRAAG